MTEAVDIRSASSPEGSTPAAEVAAATVEATEAVEGDRVERCADGPEGGGEEEGEVRPPEPGWKGRKVVKR